MAKRKRGSTKELRQIYTENPHLLSIRSNDEFWEIWKQSHNGREPAARLKNNLSNLKSTLRNEQGKGGKVSRAAKASDPVDDKTAALETLEIGIENCMMNATGLGMNDVIGLLRQARRFVSGKILRNGAK